jgi:hypothetical protein
LALVAALLASGARAAAQAPPAAQAAPAADAGDARLHELVERQHALEARLRRQQELLQTLQKMVALPPPDAPLPTGHLVVDPLAVGPDDPELTAPLAGYSNKAFFLRDRHSWFVLVPKGRVNVDYFNYLNRPSLPVNVADNGPNDPRSSLRDTIFIKRARLGIAGTIARGIDFRLEAELASLAAPGQYATLADASVLINYTKYLKLEAGQFYVPLTLENMTSENYTDFMEKAAAVRLVQPLPRDTGGMLLGELPRALGRWYVGVFNGDGQNTKNLDNEPAVAGRLFVAPLSLLARPPAWLEEIWVGGSFWWQQADNVAGGVAPSTSGPTTGDLQPITTQGNFTIFNPVFANGTDANKDAIRAHLAPNGTTLKYAFELNVPLFARYGLRSEYTHERIDIREYDDVNPGNGNLTRTAAVTGSLAGWGTYVEAYAWIGGPIEVDKPGLYSLPHWTGYRPPPAPRWALQLAAKYEHVEWNVSGLAAKDPAVGRYALDVFELGANLWVTRHARLMINYLYNYVGNFDAKLAAVQLQKNLYFKNAEQELLLRLDVHL